jgi:hypothetical protein
MKGFSRRALHRSGFCLVSDYAFKVVDTVLGALMNLEADGATSPEAL